MKLDNYYLEENKLRKIILLQKWWKIIFKIIFIQKCIKGFLSRRNISNLLYFIKCSIKLLFKLVINKIKQKTISKYDNKKGNSYINSNLRNYNINSNNNLKNKKNLNLKNNRNISNNIFGDSNNLYFSKNSEDMKKIENKKIKIDKIKKKNNNSINMNKTNIQHNNNTNDINSTKCFNKINKRKLNKDKDKMEFPNLANKDKIIANNIFNIYNNVKKYYETENNNNIYNANYYTTNNFYIKNKKSPFGRTNNDVNNDKIKTKKLATKGSAKNINEKIIINKNNNINVNININNNPRTDRANRYSNSVSKETDSIIYLLKLKKLFLYWKSLLTRKKIVQKLKKYHIIKTPNNIRKTVSLFSETNMKNQRPISITTKKIHFSNSLLSLKLNDTNKSKNNNPYHNSILNNFKKRIHTHSNSVENNSMINLKHTNLENNENNLKNKNNSISNDICDNNVIVISQFDRSNEIKKKKEDKNNFTKNDINNIDDMKEKIYYFYAIITLIDKHNKRKGIKKCFNMWKSLIRYTRSFINSNGIEEKIISFKSLKSPHKNTSNDIKINKNSNLNLNKYKIEDNMNYQTEVPEVGVGKFIGQDKKNSLFMQRDLLTPNPIEKKIHPQLFKSNFKQTNIVYQKKFLPSKKVMNQTMLSLNFNETEDDKNMTLFDNNRNFNDFNKTIGNTLNKNNSTYINNNNDLNNSVCLRRNNFKNSVGKIREGRLNKISGNLENDDINVSPIQIHRFERKNIYKHTDFNSNNIDVNVVENYRKLDNDKGVNESNINTNNNNNEKNRITTKQIILGEKKKRYKNSHN